MNRLLFAAGALALALPLCGCPAFILAIDAIADTATIGGAVLPLLNAPPPPALPAGSIP